MTSQPIISVLMPVYNTAMFLKQCLDSIILQTESHWELIAIDDFSTDNSYSLLLSYAAQDDRIKVFKNKEKGIIPALRLAFSKSKGQLITRMDSDDRMLPGKLEVLKELLLKNGKGHIATGWVMYFSESKLGNGYQKYEKWLNNLTCLRSNFTEIYRECVIPSPCWMVWREDLLTCGAFDNDVYPEDYDLCFRFYQQQLKVVADDCTLHLWRDYPTRTSRTDKKYADQHYFDLKLNYFLQLDYQDNRPLVIWGAGKKGKKLARRLYELSIPFYWFCNNRSKWGKEIYGTELQNFELLPHLWKPQIIVAVAASDDQLEIQHFMEEHGLKAVEDYYFFC